MCLEPKKFPTKILFDHFFQTQNFFRTKIFLKSFQAEHFGLKSCWIWEQIQISLEVFEILSDPIQKENKKFGHSYIEKGWVSVVYWVMIF